jgi:hypothetical protein
MKPEDLVKIREIQECTHEDPRVWKPKVWCELQEIVNEIRRKEVSFVYVSKEGEK